jgi:hypothetical protein
VDRGAAVGADDVGERGDVGHAGDRGVIDFAPGVIAVNAVENPTRRVAGFAGWQQTFATILLPGAFAAVQALLAAAAWGKGLSRAG